jgi:CRP-like cAMP-binding protein
MASLTQVNPPNDGMPVLQRLLEAATGGPLPEWSRVAKDLSIRTFEPGGTVFLQDVSHPYVYAVRRGLLKLSYLKEDGAEWIKSFAFEGRFFASIAALEPGGRTSFMVTALEDTLLERVDYRLLATLAAHHLPWSQALCSMTMLFAARKEQRERELLTLNAENRYLAFRQAYPHLESRIPQKDLARHLGLTPVGLNRIVTRVRLNCAG